MIHNVGLIFTVNNLHACNRKILLLFFPYLGAIFLPSYGNITYVNKESNVSLPWTYDFGDAAIVLKQWSFRNTSSSSDFTPLVYLSCNTTTVWGAKCSFII